MNTPFPLLLARRKTVLLAALLIMALFVPFLPRLRADFSLESFYVVSGATQRDYRFFKGAFSRQDEQVSLFVQGIGLDGPGCLALEAIARDLESIGLTRILWYGTVVPGADCGRPGELPRLLTENPLFEMLLWNHARDTFVIAGSIAPADNHHAFLRGFGRKLDGVAARHRIDGRRVEASGTPVITARYLEAMERDQFRFLPVALGLMFLLLFFLSGTLPGTILFFLSVLPAWIVTLGLMALLDVRISSLLSVLPVILVIVGVSDSIHLLSPLTRTDGEPGPAIAATFSRLWFPCLLTSLTTALGFASLMITRIPIVVEFAWVTAAGILITWCFSMTLFPVLLSFSPPVRTSRAATCAIAAMTGLHAFTRRRHRWILALTLAAVVLGAVMYRPMDSTVYMVDDLDTDHPVARSMRGIDQKGFGLFQINLVMKAGGASLYTPAGRAWMRAFSKFAVTRDGIRKVIGPEDILARMQASIPVPVEDWEPLLQTQTGKKALDGFHNVDAKAGQMLLFTGDLGTRHTDALLGVLETWISKNPPPFEVALTGTLVVANRSFAAFTSGFWRSLVLALGLILLVLLLVSRRPLVSLLLLIPSLLPLLACLFVAGRLGWRLTPSVVLVFSVALGLIVDNSIHLFGRIMQARREGLPAADQVGTALSTAGVSVLLSSVIISGGFAGLMFSQFRAISGLGTLMVLASFFSLLANLVILPAALHAFGRPSRS
ncbi:MMPL family transporter [Myxococcota bacterium]|nr:MMPL family transporter [Myxococcota bacterium]MBU1411573.1 MMPL family transporter [Myxococcota bacterium]MBU1509103.1 MMPL family transporter [Myxococcota bacterium]